MLIASLPPGSPTIALFQPWPAGSTITASRLQSAARAGR